MVRLVSGAVLSLLIWLLMPTEAPPQSNLSLIGGRTRREVNCRDQQEYRSGGICCLTCPAGTYVTSPCRTSGQQGVCQECDDGTYMEHTNGLSQCFRCTQCRPDQEVLKQCAHTHNTECRCRPGRFCDPDQACELCKRCSRCGQDEETVRNCTPTANTECKKVRSSSAPPTVGVSVIVLLSLAAVAVIIFVVIFVCIWKRRKRAASQNLSEEQKTGHRPNCPSINARQLVRTNSFKHTTEERKVLCESLNSSASNSQYSLTGLTSCSSPASPPVANPAAPPQPLWREDEQFPRLVAVNGEESLRNCFEYFEELNMDYHKKFFRHLGISDNTIKAKEGLPYEDRIHALLNVWIEKAGSEASLNDLLQVLLNLGQCRTAEVIKEKAVHHRHYRCEG
ncbi:hematopoietic death receptor isoform X1 [Takifugu flavidus]|uniref:hematopoietic death receptor isoform X1 n=1 Tax=Takifugu flavidus TaxID=433684 RepID=UPI0025442ACA|nr:hematopoietic death receptor isoform X1 [Takifugu flavidus]